MFARASLGQELATRYQSTITTLRYHSHNERTCAPQHLGALAPSPPLYPRPSDLLPDRQ